MPDITTVLSTPAEKRSAVHRNMIFEWLASIHFLKTVPLKKLSGLTECLSLETYKDNEIVIKQRMHGEVGRL